MASNGHGSIIIPVDDWLKFLSTYVPVPPEAEVMFSSRLQANDDEIILAFAWDDNDQHPSEWVERDKPEWMKKTSDAGWRDKIEIMLAEAGWDTSSMGDVVLLGLMQRAIKTLGGPVR